jgi:hypothetical protein
MAAIEKLGGKLIVMASRALARVAKSPADYERVYDRILQPGEAAGRPALAGRHVRSGAGRLLGHEGRGRRDGHGAGHHRGPSAQGRRHQDLPARQGQGNRHAPPPAAGRAHVHGDDFNYAELIAGDGFGSEPTHGKSDALLGIFDAIAPAASAALGELAQGNLEKFHAILGPTVPLSRHIFARPRAFYKTGVVFMAWLNGHQKHFTMVGGQQSTRSLPHLPSCSAWPMRPTCWSSPSWPCAG